MRTLAEVVAELARRKGSRGGILPKPRRVTAQNASNRDDVRAGRTRTPGPDGWVTFEVPGRPWLANELRTMHWARRRGIRDELSMAVWSYGQGSGPFPKERVEIRIELFRRGTRKQDKDNRYASVKYLLDALVANGWARSDSEKWCALEVREEAGTKIIPRTVIRWRPCARLS